MVKIVYNPLKYTHDPSQRHCRPVLFLRSNTTNTLASFCEDGYGGDVVSISWSFGPTILPTYLNDSKSMKKKIPTDTAMITAPAQC